MNTLMWEHPFTCKQLKVLVEQLGFVVVDPVSKQLVCKDVGMGAMAEVETIFNVVHSKAIELLACIKWHDELDQSKAMIEEKMDEHK